MDGRFVVAGLLCGLMTNCGGGSSGACKDASVVGSWTNADSGQTLTFGGDCHYSDNVCNHSGTYPNVTASEGTVLLTIESTGTAASCLAVGPHECSYSITVGGQVLTVSCVEGAEAAYVKQ